MKTVILRSPETDRKLVEIPSRLSDLEDEDGVPFVPVTGLARLIAGTYVYGSLFMDSPTAFPFDEWPLERNVTQVEGGFAVGAAGLYMITVNVDWEDDGNLMAPGKPPTAAARQGYLSVNDGTDIYFLDKADYGVGTPFFRGKDSGSYTLSLEADDTVKVILDWDSTIDIVANGGRIGRASLSIYRLP